jgi:hypothetical protein
LYPDEVRLKKEKVELSDKQYQSKLNKEFKLISEYKGVDNLVTLQHKKCKETFSITAKTFLINQHCPKCEHNITGTVKKIIDILTSEGYACIPEYVIGDCKNIHALKYDLGIFKDDKLTALIEHDTIHHYAPLFGVKQLEDMRYLDEIKNEYCKKNNILLLRIPFWEEKNVKKFLNKEIIKRKRK